MSLRTLMIGTTGIASLAMAAYNLVNYVQTQKEIHEYNSTGYAIAGAALLYASGKISRLEKRVRALLPKH